MITIKEVGDPISEVTKKTFVCPNCKFDITFWAYAILKCRECGKDIPNIYSIYTFKNSRLLYHFTGKVMGPRI